MPEMMARAEKRHKLGAGALRWSAIGRKSLQCTFPTCRRARLNEQRIGCGKVFEPVHHRRRERSAGQQFRSRLNRVDDEADTPAANGVMEANRPIRPSDFLAI